MAAKTSRADVIELPKFEPQELTVTLVGDTPLIVHAWSEKAKRQMRDKQQKKATTGKEAKDPQAEFEGALYRLPDGGYGFPTVAFKAAAVRAANDAGIQMTLARRAFHIDGDFVRLEAPEPTMREDMVRVGMGVADIRYRPEFWPWKATLTIRYNESIISAEQVVNLFRIAGFGVGIGEWRPERNGQFGRFSIG